jgi:polysaccharide deacetylase 2 family uncharacterized protein YibQ
MSPKKKKARKRKIKVSLRYMFLFLVILFLASAYFSFKAFSTDSYQLKPTVQQKSESRQYDKSHITATLDADKGEDCLSPKQEMQEGSCKSDEEHALSITNKTDGLSQENSFKKIVKKETPDISQIYKTGKAVPKIALIIDDLGPNKRPVMPLLDSFVPLIFSILPQETYSSWIADKANERGYEIIAHIPMEADKENKLGKGGLYRWMSADDIHRILKEDLDSIPHIVGVSNHMGSAFTSDEHAMDILMSELKKQELLFVDSFTTLDSAGTRTAKKYGIRTFKRDIFLDNSDNPDDIRKQWHKALDIAKRKGYAIVLAHPRKNTIDFLRTAFQTAEVEFVTLSELPVPQ